MFGKQQQGQLSPLGWLQPKAVPTDLPPTPSCPVHHDESAGRLVGTSLRWNTVHLATDFIHVFRSLLHSHVTLVRFPGSFHTRKVIYKDRCLSDLLGTNRKLVKQPRHFVFDYIRQSLQHRLQRSALDNLVKVMAHHTEPLCYPEVQTWGPWQLMMTVSLGGERWNLESVGTPASSYTCE